MKGVEIRFNSQAEYNSTLYSYICMFDQVKIGDLVVVQARESYGLGHVVSISDTISRKATRHVVVIVETEAFERQIRKLEEIKQIEDQLREEVRLHLAKKQYEEFAKENQTIADLLLKLKSAQNDTPLIGGKT